MHSLNAIILCFFQLMLVLAVAQNETLEEKVEKEKQLVNNVFYRFNNNKDVHNHVDSLLKEVETDFALVNLNFLLARCFLRTGLTDSSILYVNRGLQINLQNKNDTIRGLRNSIGYEIKAIAYTQKGLINEAKKWFQKGLFLALTYEAKNLYYKHAHGIATMYMQMERYEEALSLYKECLEYKEDLEIITGSYINIGEIYEKKEVYDTSDIYLEEGLILAEKNELIQASIAAKFGLAVNAQFQNKPIKAIKLYEEVIASSENNNLNKYQSWARLKMGTAFVELGRYSDAELIFTTELRNVLKTGNLSGQLIVYENLEMIAIHQYNYEKAHRFSKLFSEVKDSIITLQKDKEINNLEIKYQVLERENEIKVLQVENTNRKLELFNREEVIKNLKLEQEIENKENENKVLSLKNEQEKTKTENILLRKDREIKEVQSIIQQTEIERQKRFKNTILYFFLILTIPLIGLLLVYYQKLQAKNELSKKQEEINQKNVAALLKDQELKLIKASINGQNEERKRVAQELHDSIGGNLAAIKLRLSNIAMSESEDELASINIQIDDTYHQVRDLSHNLIPKKFNENTFCDVLEEYLNNIIRGSNITSSFSAWPKEDINLIKENLQIEIFKIIQELITNTIKHANATSIELQLNLIENVLGILFEDNGVGFLEDEIKDGIGFTNMKSRLSKIEGTLHIDSRLQKGTIINIEIPNKIV